MKDKSLIAARDSWIMECLGESLRPTRIIAQPLL